MKERNVFDNTTAPQLATVFIVLLCGIASVSAVTLEVKEQYTVLLNCMVNVTENANPWTHDNQTLSDTDERIRIYDNGSLEIKHFSQKDVGSYVCTDENGDTVIDYNLTFQKAIPPVRPEPPTIKQVTSQSVILMWKEPYDNGWEITQYNISIRQLGSHEWSNATSTNETSAEIQDLIPYVKYEFQLFAKNLGGISEGSGIIINQTKPALPGDSPTIDKIDGNICRTLKVEWTSEDKLYGEFEQYIVQYFWKENNNKTLIIEEKDPKSFNISELMDGTEYTVTMAVKNQVGRGNFSNKSDPNARMSTIKLDKYHIKAPSPKVNKKSSKMISLEWEKPHLEEMVGKVVGYNVSYQLSTLQTMESEFVFVNTTHVILRNLVPDSEYLITIATITDCGTGNPSKEISETTKPQSSITTEPPIVPSSSPNDLPSDTSPPEDSNNRAIVIGIVTLLAVLVIILVVLILIYLTYRRKGYLVRSSDTSQRGKFTPLPGNDSFLPGKISGPYISVKAFPEHVAKNHLNTDLIFSDEYESILEDSSIDGATSNASKEPDNKEKNRYVNILPYDHSRVKLHQLAGKCKYSDYINANYIDGYQKPHSFIATQGPLRSTFDDFWGMVWEQQSCVIVMLTNLVEKGRTKCDKYWPSGQSEHYGHFKVTNEDVQIMASFVIRRFSLKNTHSRMAGERVVWQFHYTCWPDHGVPEDALPLLTFIRKSTSVNPDSAGPIIIHCSAGVGRTGTFITLDAMIRQIADKQTINVQGFLRYIRKQRAFMVQTEEQYVFIHDALLEYLQFGVTHIQLADLTLLVNEELEKAEDGQPSLLEKQFKQIMSYKHKEFEFLNAKKPVNVPKNRSADMLPVERSRVNISPKPGVEGSEYVNASWLPGYHKELEYIVTQHPLTNTAEDYWQLVWDHNSPTIIMLSSEEDKEANDKPIYWPVDKDNPLTCNSFTVNLLEEKVKEGSTRLTIREFLLQSMDDYSLQVRQFHVSNWPDGCSPMTNVFQLINYVENWRQAHPGRILPVTVHDSCGGFEAGVFCALSTLQQQLKEDGEVDVCQVVNLYNRRRPGMFTDKDGYRFLYRAMESLAAESPRKVLSVSRSSSLRSSRPSRHPLNLSAVRRVRSMQPQPRTYHQREPEEEEEEEVADSSV